MLSAKHIIFKNIYLPPNLKYMNHLMYLVNMNNSIYLFIYEISILNEF